jgi:DNA-binding transcriptional LysR family regulator
MKRFATDYPEASIAIHTGHSSTVTQWVDDQTRDLGIVSHLSEAFGLEHEKLYEVNAVCVMPQGHPLTSKSFIVPNDLINEPYISLPRNEYGYSAVDAIFEVEGISRNVNLETPYSSITCSLVAQGLGVALVNPLAALDYRHTGIVIKPFLPEIKHSGYLIYPKGRPDDRLISSFLNTMKATLKDDLIMLAQGQPNND